MLKTRSATLLCAFFFHRPRNATLKLRRTEVAPKILETTPGLFWPLRSPLVSDSLDFENSGLKKRHQSRTPNKPCASYECSLRASRRIH
ncbi:hypothetical protein L596_018156 [Steinernema carpocapsae]|uniref:Uncharacterized protein n=1 Tax=Steinernema carpocapsae TaxID=34508 RepID=A0A4U5N4J7_STECR|nr:hypothetical protein L596_018156 [Steinernema carpocapsae]